MVVFLAYSLALCLEVENCSVLKSHLVYVSISFIAVPSISLFVFLGTKVLISQPGHRVDTKNWFIKSKPKIVNFVLQSWSVASRMTNMKMDFCCSATLCHQICFQV